MKWRVVWAEATSGLMLAGGAVTFAVAVLLSVLGANAPLWSDRTRVATVICIYTVPLLMAVAAIVAGRRMAGLSALASASPVGGRHPAKVVALAGSLWAGVVFLAQALLPLVLIPPVDPLPPTALLSWPQALVSLVAGAWVGAMAGVWLRGRLAGPLLAVVAFGWFYLSMYLDGRLRLAAPFDSPWYVPWIQPAPGAPIGHTLLGAALVLAAAAVFSNSTVRRRVLLAIAALAVPAAVVAISSVAEAERYEGRPMPDGPVCESVGDGSTFCAHPLAAETREETARALRSVRAAIGDLWAVPASMIHHAYPGRPGDVVVPMAYGADREAHLSNAAFALRPQCADSPAGLASQDNVYQWLMVRVGLHHPAPDDPLIDVHTLPEDGQIVWVRDQLRAGSCQ